MEIGSDGFRLDFLGHAGILISNGKRIAIDPFNISDKAAMHKVDLILITHSHYDHCSIADIEKLADKGTVIICPPDCQSRIMKVEGIEMHIMEVGDKMDLDDIQIEAVPAYNKKKEYHPKGEGWLGYVVKMGKVIVYHTGDTDFIPEMQKLSGHGKHGNEFVALLPVSGKYVMNPKEAAEAASLISPSLAIPIHFGAGVAGTVEDAQEFVKLCKGKHIKALILEKI